ncbi:hypothetical protein [Pantoea sp. y20]
MTPRFTTIPAWAIRTSAVVVILTLLLLVSVVHAWHQHRHLEATFEQVQQQLLAHQQAANKIAEKVRRETKEKYSPPAVLDLLNPIGKALSADVSLLEIDASLQQKNIRLEVAAKTLPALLDYSGRLQQIPARVELQNHRVKPDKERAWPVSATLTLNIGNKGDSRHE